MSKNIASLKSDLSEIKGTVETQSKQIDQLATDFKGLQKIDEGRKGSRETRDKSDIKMRKDSSRESVVAKKPKLVEKQINTSFDVFTKELQEVSK
ncbi:Rz protein [Yersinia phage vB_YenM_TG1]|uniref:Rz protein n=1 Tax=Yersinia phage vB_YenM_TG1 TaxID=1589265 RepID=A0A0B5A2Y8_9CAUD|nr:Rz-like spanin [Yersinia phage vB_YenM_TG1]AJD82035.1 Rz protein [Yersinia phage vB_YenM_TG1]